MRVCDVCGNGPAGNFLELYGKRNYFDMFRRALGVMPKFELCDSCYDTLHRWLNQEPRFVLKSPLYTIDPKTGRTFLDPEGFPAEGLKENPK